MAMVPTPPNTTAGTVPNHCAAIPDSNWPTSLDAPIKTTFTALTRPRISSGVESWMSVWRTITLTMSHAPISANAASERASLRDKPKITVKTPKPHTHHSMIAPACRRKGQRVTTRAMMTAPTPGALRRIPSPDAIDHEHKRRHHHDKADHKPSETGDAFVEAREHTLLGDRACYLTKSRPRAGEHDDTAADAADDRATHEADVGEIERRLRSADVGSSNLLQRHRLAGERRLVDEKVLR